MRIPAVNKASASVIFLHGLGDSGQGWMFLPQEAFQRASLKHINFVLPDAPVRNHPGFGGQRAPGWFSVTGFGAASSGANVDIKGIAETISYVKKLIHGEIEKGIPADRIVLGGFSQGGAITYMMAATMQDLKLAGLTPLSGFLPSKDYVVQHKTDKNVNTPVFIGHGTADEIVPLKRGVEAQATLREIGFSDVRFKEYNGMPHSASEKELQDLFDFFEEVLPQV